MGFTPKRTPGGMLGDPIPYESAFNANDAMAANFQAALGGAVSMLGSANSFFKPNAMPPPAPDPNRYQGGLLPGPYDPSNTSTWPSPPPLRSID